jgi:hypothetical protein
MRWIVSGILLLLFLSLPLIAAEEPTGAAFSAAAFSVLKYFPGDVVHLVVDVPPDVVSVSATMPDGEQINLGYSQRSRIWHNYWEVPAGFKKGGYTARLKAIDVEGRVFEGESDLIYIGEPTLPMVMKLAPTKEVQVLPLESVKGKVAATKAPKQIKKKPKPAKKRRVVKPAAPSRLRLLVEAREQLFRQDYGKLKTKLDALIKIDPDNNEIRTMRRQVAKGEKIKP